MSAIRNLFSGFRRERRNEQSLPYSRSGRPSAEKKDEQNQQPTSIWGYFNVYSFVSGNRIRDPSDDIVCVVEDRDVEMADDEVSAPTTEESTTDTSVETVESVESVEPTKSVETPVPTEPAMSAQSTEPAQSTSNASSSESVAEPVSFIPPPPPTASQPITSEFVEPSSTTVPPVFTSDDTLIDWARQKVDKHEKITQMDYLAFKTFLETRRRGVPFTPIQLRFSRSTSVLPSSTARSSPNVSLDASGEASSQHPASSGSTSVPSSASNPSAPSWAETGCRSGFSGTASLPPFTINVPRSSNGRSRLLKRNPNGSMILRGAGSARNVPEQGRKRSAPIETPRIDPYKRRKIFEETSGPVRAPNAVASQSAPVLGSAGLGTGPSLPRTGINLQRAVPHAPSPLRNVINGSPPSSPPRRTQSTPTNLNASSSGSTSVNKTASAALLERVIEEVTPRAKQPDVANPYQTAAPVKPVIKPMEKKRMSERRTRTREVEKQKEAAKKKEVEKKELTAKEIIEATVPKGAKRSRPPPGLNKFKAAHSAVPEPSSNYIVEEPEEESVQKKKRRTVTVEEIVDEDDGAKNRSFPIKSTSILEEREPEPTPARAPPPPTRAAATKVPSSEVSSAKAPPSRTMPAKTPASEAPSVKVPSSKEASVKESSRQFVPLLPKIPMHGTGKSSRPKEPSKLRTSFLPDDEGENETPKFASLTPIPVVTMTTPGTPLAEVQEKKDPKEVALTLPLNDLPTFVFKTPPPPVAIDHTDARVAAKELPVTSLPKFDFSKARTINGICIPAVPIPMFKSFDFAAAGVKPKSPGTNGQWECSTCMCHNPVSATEKCEVCDAPRPATEKREKSEKTKKASVNGVKSSKSVNGVNGINGKALSPKPNGVSTAPPAIKTFDFAAAGIKPKEPLSDGQWECSSCMLQNPATALEKCSVCDAPRLGAQKASKAGKAERTKTERTKKPYMNGTTHSSKPLTNGTTHSSKPLTNGTSAPAAKTFDFAAAGIKTPAPHAEGSWKCPTCMLQNPATALEKCKVCDSPRPGVEKKKGVKSPAPMAMPTLSVVPKAFNWAAAGLVPKLMENGGTWTCGTCSLSNPPTETEKCKICDASRS